MASIHIRREHNLHRSDAKAKVEELAKDLRGKLGADYHWEGDCLRFQRSGASGSIAVKDEVVEVKVKLGLVLTPMKGVIESSIQEGFDVALAGAGGSAIA